MLRVCLFLSVALTTIVGCRSSSVIRLRDRTVQKYEPSIPDAGVATFNARDYKDIYNNKDTHRKVAASAPSHPSAIQPVSEKMTVTANRPLQIFRSRLFDLMPHGTRVFMPMIATFEVAPADRERNAVRELASTPD